MYGNINSLLNHNLQKLLIALLYFTQKMAKTLVHSYSTNKKEWSINIYNNMTPRCIFQIERIRLKRLYIIYLYHIMKNTNYRDGEQICAYLGMDVRRKAVYKES